MRTRLHARRCHCDPAEKRGKQSPVIPVKTGIQEGRMAMRPYKIAGGDRHLAGPP